jgi:hypothetical protein
MVRLALGVLTVALLLGCRAAALPHAYTEQELAQECLRHGGWWHEDELRGGFCEYQSPGMI